MSIRISARYFRIALVAAAAAFGGAALAQQAPPPPSANAIALAKQLLTMKGTTNFLDPIVIGVVEQSKNTFMQTNINLSRELNEVGAMLRTEFAPRQAALINDVARLYAQRFTEQELKDTVAFFNTPLGKKILTEEPYFVQASYKYAEDWANNLSVEVIGRFRAEMKKKGKEI
jgi:hypothetical protein